MDWISTIIVDDGTGSIGSEPMVRNCNLIVDIGTQEVVNLLELHFDQLEKSRILNFRPEPQGLRYFQPDHSEPNEQGEPAATYI